MTREVVGRVPEGRDAQEYDRMRRRVLWSLPSGIYLIGSSGTFEGARRWNLMTANLVVQVSMDPKIIAASMEVGSLTRSLVRDSGAFSVSLIDRADRALVRRFVKPVSEVELDADGAPTSMGGEGVLVAATGSPILRRSPAWLDCSVVQEVELGSHGLFLGEVVDASGSFEGDERLSVLRMEDTRMNYGG